MMVSNLQPLGKILISGCFLGQRVRYNGEIKPLINELLTLWQQQGRLISICPEVISGLPVPRPAAEINLVSGKVITVDGSDVTEKFNQGAQQALKLCQQHNIEFALLKESSPSCGSTTIYDGTFSQQKISGAGVTTKLLRQHGIKVYSEDSITALAEQIKASDQTS
ncbi:DUF523 domain-containing protein [Colwellia piezophila]|uniref:DUF523 domain-containing protein n=1 Tax=Colwellia piezophila TaxID=211668 RepID=UPI0003754EB0|nr:DUF523 domain-containing protein [Colwellia piezophila]